jgi:hypothetical protein
VRNHLVNKSGLKSIQVKENKKKSDGLEAGEGKTTINEIHAPLVLGIVVLCTRNGDKNGSDYFLTFSMDSFRLPMVFEKRRKLYHSVQSVCFFLSSIIA